VPKIKSKEEAIKQVSRCAAVLKKALIEKYGDDYDGRQIGRGDLKDVLGKHGDRFKDVVMGCVKKFGIKKFLDPEAEIMIIVLDEKKPLFQVRKIGGRKK